MFFYLVPVRKMKNRMKMPIENNKDYAPANIVGSSIVVYSALNKITVKASDFKSNGQCTIPLISDAFILTDASTYSFTKKQENKTILVLNVAYKVKIGSDCSYMAETYTIDLIFNEATGGTYNRVNKCIMTGNASSLNWTKSRTINGTFNVFKAF